MTSQIIQGDCLKVLRKSVAGSVDAIVTDPPAGIATVKSTALMRHLIRLVAAPGDLVLDMFAGSGSTGVAALAEGMRFIGIEQDAESVKTARRRLRVRPATVTVTPPKPAAPQPHPEAR